MPYNPKQCRYFPVAEKRGQSVPDDWRQHCHKPTEKDKDGKRKQG